MFENSGALCGPKHVAVPFMAPDVDIMLKHLIQKISCPYPQLVFSFLLRFPS